jgi:hypothetical protein
LLAWLAGDFFTASAGPLTKLMARNNLAPGDIDAVELLGGGSRVPRLQVGASQEPANFCKVDGACVQQCVKNQTKGVFCWRRTCINSARPPTQC